LQHQVFQQPSHRILRQGCCNGRAQLKAAPQAARHVVFAAALPRREVAGGMDAALAGIKAKHDLAQADALPAAGIGCFDRYSVHFFSKR
jgi:hypothetical protein